MTDMKYDAAIEEKIDIPLPDGKRLRATLRGPLDDSRPIII